MKIESQHEPGLRIEPGISGTGALREFVGTRVARYCSQAYGTALQNVILTGSLARDEATLIPEEYGWRIPGDAEFILIFRDRARLPEKSGTRTLQDDIETSLFQAGISGQVDLGVAHESYLRGLRPDIFAYELGNCGKVLWGPSTILDAIPKFVSTEIPLEDGWRMLSNRMVEHLETFEEARRRPKALSQQACYRTVKLYLDAATSLLIFVGKYAPSYAERARQLEELAASQSRIGDASLPFDLRKFARRVAECTEWKISSGKPSPSLSFSFLNPPGFAWWEEAVGYAGELWRWELGRLTQQHAWIPTQELLRLWMRRQNVSRRLQGWLYVARDQGWLRSWRRWPRWAKLAWQASPRYWVYAVGCEMFAAGSRHVQRDSQFSGVDMDWDRLRAHLPVRPALKGSRGLSEWSRMRKEVAWNYERFLTGTRA
jgi:hypothetical protein